MSGELGGERGETNEKKKKLRKSRKDSFWAEQEEIWAVEQGGFLGRGKGKARRAELGEKSQETDREKGVGVERKRKGKKNHTSRPTRKSERTNKNTQRTTS